VKKRSRPVKRRWSALWTQPPWARQSDGAPMKQQSAGEPVQPVSRSREIERAPEKSQQGGLSQAKTHWVFGEWEALTKIGPKTLYEHAERDRLALLMASAHTQLGSHNEAREHVHLALKWGCPPRLVAQVLIAGVHNTLARAAAIAGQGTRAQKHFERAVMIDALGTEGRLVTQARTGNQLAQLGLGTDAVGAERREQQANQESLNTNTETAEATGTPGIGNADVVTQLKQQKESIDSLRQDIAKLVRKEMLGSAKQLEALVEVRNYLNTGELLGEMHGWAIGPDLALHLVKMIESNNYDVVIEFGSGTSTVLIARALAKAAARRERKPQAVQLAFEHLEEYRQQTLTELRQAGMSDRVQLNLAPLVPYVAPNGGTYSYYDCHHKLADLSRRLGASLHRILVLVDGPPGRTGKHARFPALPVLLSYFPNDRLDILMDDFARTDEREIAELWLADARRRGLSAELAPLEVEKGACVIALNHG